MKKSKVVRVSSVPTVTVAERARRWCARLKHSHDPQDLEEFLAWLRESPLHVREVIAIEARGILTDQMLRLDYEADSDRPETRRARITDLFGCQGRCDPIVVPQIQYEQLTVNVRHKSRTWLIALVSAACLLIGIATGWLHVLGEHEHQEQHGRVNVERQRPVESVSFTPKVLVSNEGVNEESDLPTQSPLHPQKEAVRQQPRGTLSNVDAYEPVFKPAPDLGSEVNDIPSEQHVLAGSDESISIDRRDIADSSNIFSEEERIVVLADGSGIQLGAKSEIQIAFSLKGRDVHLLKGQATFTVARDRRRPFRVHISSAVVQAVGTRFDVDTRADVSGVTVTEGKVKVTATVNVSSATSKLSRNVSAGKQVTIAADGYISPPVSINNSRWGGSPLVFRDATLLQVVEEFRRYNRSPEIIVTGFVRTRRYTGVFDARDVENFLDYLAFDPVYEVNRSDKGVVEIRLRHRMAPIEEQN